MKMKTAELTRPALDWAVAKCEGFKDPSYYPATFGLVSTLPNGLSVRHDYSTDPAQGHPIIEREGIATTRIEIGCWMARDAWKDYYHEGMEGPTALIAAMRCYAASKLGDEIDVPEELLS